VINIEKASNGYIIRGKKGGVPTTWVATSVQQLMAILEECDK
jgi:hypothetical protein